MTKPNRLWLGLALGAFLGMGAGVKIAYALVPNSLGLTRSDQGRLVQQLVVTAGGIEKELHVIGEELRRIRQECRH